MRIGDCHKTWELWQQWNVNLEVERQFRREAQYSIFFLTWLIFEIFHLHDTDSENIYRLWETIRIPGPVSETL